MKCPFMMGSGTVICVPSFIKIGSAIQKMMEGGDTQTHRQHGDRINLLVIFSLVSLF
jgi:hypothetical protein